MGFDDNLIFSFELLVSRLAEPIVKRIVWKVKRQLQSFNRKSGMMQTDEYSNLQNVWDEFCIQVQGEQSVFYDSYLDIILSLIRELLKNCTTDEKIILWMQTQEYEDWISVQESESDDFSNVTDILEHEYDVNAVCEYLLQEVEQAACNYLTKRIEDFLYSGETD